MCHAVPAQVVDILADDRVRVEVGGVQKTVSTVLVGPVEPGDYLIVHVGFALNRLDPEEAEATLAALAELAALNEASTP